MQLSINFSSQKEFLLLKKKKKEKKENKCVQIKIHRDAPNDQHEIVKLTAIMGI